MTMKDIVIFGPKMLRVRIIQPIWNACAQRPVAIAPQVPEICVFAVPWSH